MRVLTVTISGPFPVTVGRVRKSVSFMQADLLWVAEVVAVWMFANFNIFPVVWHFPSWFKLIVLSHLCITPADVVSHAGVSTMRRTDEIHHGRGWDEFGALIR